MPARPARPLRKRISTRWLTGAMKRLMPVIMPALELYTRAADAGNARGINNLGWSYQNGLGVEQDYEKAADWFHKAVELGETNEAQVNYDKLIEEGKIPADYVPKDISF